MSDENKKSPFTSRFDRAEFGKRIRKARKGQDFTQKELAEMTWKNREGSYISNFETDRNATTLDGAVEIANALGVSLDYLCCRDDFIKRPITMGDIARVLLLLPFLSGIDYEVVDEYINSDSSAQDSGNTSTKKKRVAFIKVKKKPLNKFLDEYWRKLTYRTKYSDFVKWMETSLAELDTIPAWEKRDEIKWDQHVNPRESWTFPEEKFKPLIWNWNFPDIPKGVGNDMSEKTNSAGE